MSLLRPLGSTGIDCHPLGFGCYRVAAGNPAQAGALTAYLEQGGNLVDTSANYMDGESEVLVGKLLRNYARDRIIVVTKGGYIQGRNMALARERNFPEVVKYAEGLWHSIHPEFLETQVRLSAERMQVGYVDVYLLHNPEYYLEQMAHRRAPQAADHEEFYRRVREAFRFLETQVERGKIRWYGVSSNNYGSPSSSPTHTSVERTLAEAESVSSNHHFRVVQLPLNLYESGGALEPNNDGKTVLEFCREKGLGVLANRPLNAAAQNRLVRLADSAARQGVSNQVRARLAQAGYPPSGESLSRLALNVLLGLEGLSGALVGMRRVEYVEDAMGAAGLDRVDSLKILERFAA